jgi:alanine racemase
LARPGAALYSVNPIEGGVNPMNSVIRLVAPIIHLQDLGKDLPVGYCMKYLTQYNRNLIATLPIGYADGYPRALGNERGKVFLNGVEAPVVGNVSMDLITIDVTNVPNVKMGDYAEIYGENCTIDEMASKCGTIGYEILTSLGHRFKRIYLEEETAIDVNNNTH